MAETLTDYIRTNRPRGFRATPHYFPSGDYLTYFSSEERCVAERLDDVITIYLSAETKELVGCKVKGVRQILETAGAFRVAVGDDAGIRLGFFFFAGAAPDRAGQEVKLKWYERLRELADVTWDRNQLVFAELAG
ncbi:MAG: hypothetical protein ACRC7O_16255 [Fimbriiglobus sp.]